jgi:hypothetical protein
MGTAVGAGELGLCSHGLACHAGAWAATVGFCLGYMAIFGKSKQVMAGKNILRGP